MIFQYSFFPWTTEGVMGVPRSGDDLIAVDAPVPEDVDDGVRRYGLSVQGRGASHQREPLETES